MPRDFSSVRMPRETHGQCKHKKCKRVEWLANNLCVLHWDLTLDKHDREEVPDAR